MAVLMQTSCLQMRISPLSTSNASVTLQIAPDLNADLSMSTSNGQILVHQCSGDGPAGYRHWTARILGQGGHQVTVTTSNADIEVRMLTL
jgi:hypothetical protein